MYGSHNVFNVTVIFKIASAPCFLCSTKILNNHAHTTTLFHDVDTLSKRQSPIESVIVDTSKIELFRAQESRANWSRQWVLSNVNIMANKIAEQTCMSR